MSLQCRRMPSSLAIADFLRPRSVELGSTFIYGVRISFESFSGVKMAQGHENPFSLPVFDKVPRSKLAIPGLALKFLGKTSVFLYTEALGKRSHHGRTAILVNEHTTGAAEILAQFAQENKLATIVGTKTPGRLVSRSASKLGFGYRLIVPVAAYVSAKGTQIEGKGITPDIDIAWSFPDAMEDRDNQLTAAIEVL